MTATKIARRLRVCPKCGFRANLPDDGAPMFCVCQSGQPVPAPEPVDIPDPGFGPGTELKKLLADLGISMSADCGCKAMAKKMNVWGVAGCREHHGKIVAHLKQAAERREWHRKWSASVLVNTAFVGLRVNWLDPIPGLVDLAIERAEMAR
jgi:hypothetical protein